MGSGISCGKGRQRVEPEGLTVLLLEPKGILRVALKGALESLSVGVISARSAGRALEFCSTPHLRFGALVLGPSLLELALDTFVGRLLSVRKRLHVLALIAGEPPRAGESRMTPLAVCWTLERLGCPYSLLEEPWTGARLHPCLEELLGRSFEPAA
jgi:hypothetical protein